jgi:hypothetical protein
MEIRSVVSGPANVDPHFKGLIITAPAMEASLPPPEDSATTGDDGESRMVAERGFNGSLIDGWHTGDAFTTMFKCIVRRLNKVRAPATVLIVSRQAF